MTIERAVVAYLNTVQSVFSHATRHKSSAARESNCSAPIVEFNPIDLFIGRKETADARRH